LSGPKTKKIYFLLIISIICLIIFGEKLTFWKSHQLCIFN